MSVMGPAGGEVVMRTERQLIVSALQLSVSWRSILGEYYNVSRGGWFGNFVVALPTPSASFFSLAGQGGGAAHPSAYNLTNSNTEETTTKHYWKQRNT